MKWSPYQMMDQKNDNFLREAFTRVSDLSQGQTMAGSIRSSIAHYCVRMKHVFSLLKISASWTFPLAVCSPHCTLRVILVSLCLAMIDFRYGVEVPKAVEMGSVIECDNL